MTVAVIVLFVLVVAMCAYTWYMHTQLSSQSEELRTDTEILKTRVIQTEESIGKLAGGDKVIPAVKLDDANTVINQKEQEPATPAKAEPAKAEPAKAEPARRPKKRSSKRTVTQSITYTPHTTTATRSTQSTAPERFGTTYTPPATVHYAVLIDSFNERRQADITKTLFAVKYGAYIRKVGANYNVYAGWYTVYNNAQSILKQLRQAYGPSCRIVTLYN
jgi:hypothetical protein